MTPMVFPVQRDPSYLSANMPNLNKRPLHNCKIEMCPYKGYSNSPYMNVLAYSPDILACTYKYDAATGCYYLQTPEGYTDFFYHQDAIQVSTDIKKLGWMETVQNNGGYGGRPFPIKVIRPESPDPIKLEVRGPWSGGCYCANDILPKPATEVTWKHPSTYLKNTPTINWSYTCGALTIEVVNQLLFKARLPWLCVAAPERGHKLVPEFLYAEGFDWSDVLHKRPDVFKRKEEWSADTLNQLDRDWQAQQRQSGLADFGA